LSFVRWHTGSKRKTAIIAGKHYAAFIYNVS